MLRKVIDEFDIDPTGWFDMDSSPSSNQSTELFAKPAVNIWSLWVRNTTVVQFAREEKLQSMSVMATAKHITRAFQFRSHLSRKYKNMADDQFISALLLSLNHYEGSPHFAHPTSNARDLEADLDNAQELLTDKNRNPVVCLPNFFINSKFIDSISDPYLLTDGMTGFGLEALEAIPNIIPTLGEIGCSYLALLDKACQAPDFSNGERNPLAVIAECTLDIWWALQVRDIRSRILTRWPGWADIFTAQDSLLLPASDSMQNLISKRSPHRSELRRFCMAMTWNLNPRATRVKFPRATQDAYKQATTAWPAIMATPELKGARLIAIHKFVTHLALDRTETRPKSNKTGQSPIDSSNLTGDPSNKSKMRKNQGISTILVEPGTQSPDSNGKSNEIVPGIIAPPGNWDKLLNSTNPDFHAWITEAREYHQRSIEFQSEHRARIAEKISANAWFVPNPPPLEHGNLDGTLDEGNLLRFAAFSDPNIFSTSPESGYGQIVIGILVDGSGSMGRKLHDAEGCVLPNRPNYMQAAMCFLGGVKDGLARSRNVHAECFSYDSCLNHPIHERDSHQSFIADYLPLPATNATAVCVLRRLDTDDDLYNHRPGGGTPTSCAIHTLHNHLESAYPDAYRVILVLTDGDPGAHCMHPNFPERMHDDSPEEVRRVVSSITTPVFCVGIDVHGPTLQAQYDVGHCFVVDSPLAAADVAAQLVRGIGQSLNCC